ncbi:MAG: hypothetical protein ABJB66_07210 [Gemmatimonadaceae bacterium]
MENSFGDILQSHVRDNVTMVVRTSDWLMLERGKPLELARQIEARLSVIAILSSTIERQTEIAAPNEADYATLAAGIAELPPQLAFISESSALGQWLNIATLAEHDGVSRLAQLVIDELMRLLFLQRKEVSSTIERNYIDEGIGICWARRGRLARIIGELDDAASCYVMARQVVRKLPRRDARSMADIGLSLVAIGRGNFPEATKGALRLLRPSTNAANIFQVHAHQVLALTKRRNGNLIEAMGHAWDAFDLASGNDMRRLELIGSMSEISAEFGDLDAAAHGFDTVLSANVPNRIQVPSLAGALRLCVRREEIAPSTANRRALGVYSQRFKVMIKDGLVAGDELLALLALAEGDLVLRQLQSGKVSLERAAAIAKQFGFYEKQYAVETLQARFSAAENDPDAAPTARPEKNVQSLLDKSEINWPKALRRLAEVAF